MRNYTEPIVLKFVPEVSFGMKKCSVKFGIDWFCGLPYISALKLLLMAKTHTELIVVKSIYGVQIEASKTYHSIFKPIY